MWLLSVPWSVVRGKIVRGAIWGAFNFACEPTHFLLFADDRHSLEHDRLAHWCQPHSVHYLCQVSYIDSLYLGDWFDGTCHEPNFLYTLLGLNRIVDDTLHMLVPS